MTQQLRDRIGRFGIWRGVAQVTPDLAAGVERLGYGTVWLMVGTSIVNVWKDDAATVARSYIRIDAAHPGRFVLGVGAGHPEATTEYASPYAKLATYVDQLQDGGVPAERMVLAALGPRVLSLAGNRAGGAIPYLVPPEHTRLAREILGPDRLLAPEHKAVLDPDSERGRAIGRKRVQNPYLHLVNYTSNLQRLGFSDDDLADGGSDRLIDALVAHGRPDQVAAQLSAHLDAGADHVAVQLLTDDSDPLPGYADLAGALGLQAEPA
jgi:probable F420-dependent oxidoreductase